MSINKEEAVGFTIVFSGAKDVKSGTDDDGGDGQSWKLRTANQEMLPGTDVTKSKERI